MYKFDFESVNLVTLPDKILREVSKEVPIPLIEEDVELIEKMIYHVRDSQEEETKFRPAVGVAAIQYGIPKRIFYIYIKDSEDNIIFDDALINAKLISHSKTKITLGEGEGCLSVDDDWKNQEGYVPRYTRVIIQAYSYFEKKVKTYDLIGYPAIVAQHEYDHLQGKLFIDRINKSDPWNLPENTEVLE
ncbi:peptide deformylase [Metamycoplasma hyosynoviae]|uniref:peptide deformylase n=1 Tax=Metamycoplasma hyosynoviae TaxID=29559 RepID=UPI0023589D2E|nr:peptide deformylase [Metamycoplasma hyosynoviae]MDC8918765.1 peptide deformylase [Metamycoplasma hyosynoviae]